METTHIRINGENRTMVRSEGDFEKMYEILDLILEDKKIDAIRKIREMLDQPEGKDFPQLHAAKLVVDMVLQAWNEKNQ